MGLKSSLNVLTPFPSAEANGNRATRPYLYCRQLSSCSHLAEATGVVDFFLIILPSASADGTLGDGKLFLGFSPTE